MKLNQDISDERKRAALRELNTDEHVVNRLYYSARNLAISSLLANLRAELLALGFPVQAAWTESSFGGPSIEIVLENKGRGAWEEISYYVRCNREQVGQGERTNSFYTAKSYSTPLASDSHPPSLGLKLMAELQRRWDAGEFHQLVLGLNYPFAYESHSSF